MNKAVVSLHNKNKGIKMVQTSELRENNLVLHEGKIFVVQGFDSDKQFQELKGAVNGYYLSDEYKDRKAPWSNNLQPIPLTEEILLKCGFEKSPYHELRIIYDIPNTEFQLSMHTIDGLWAFRYTGFTITTIKYLHQLQNIVFDTYDGHELTFTP